MTDELSHDTEDSKPRLTKDFIECLNMMNETDFEAKKAHLEGDLEPMVQRNALLLCIFANALYDGWPCWISYDAPLDWPVFIINLPDGQLSWEYRQYEPIKRSKGSPAERTVIMEATNTRFYGHEHTDDKCCDKHDHHVIPHTDCILR